MKSRIRETVLPLVIIAIAHTSPHADADGIRLDQKTRGSGSSVELAGMQFPWSIDNHGRVAGECDVPNARPRACMWSNGVLIDLGYDVAAYRGVYINERGQVVGTSVEHDAAGNTFFRILLWEQGTLTDLGSLGRNDFTNSASGINDRGEVVGASTTVSLQVEAFHWKRGQMTSLHVGAGYPIRINNRSQVLDEGYFWDDGEIIELSPFRGWAINDHGTVAGHREGVAASVAAIWKDGVVTELESPHPSTVSSLAVDINKRGQVVANSYSDDGSTRAFFWEKATSTDLGTLGESVLTEAIGINERGQVFGRDYGHVDEFPPFGISRAFVWEHGELTEIEPDAAAAGVSILLSDMNDRGQVVGIRSSPGEWSAFLWEDGVTIELGRRDPSSQTLQIEELWRHSNARPVPQARGGASQLREGKVQPRSK